jgi:hypothetical protein
LLLGIIVMLCWPWVIFGVFWALARAYLLNDGFANYVNHNPRNINFFITQIGTIVNLIVGYLFSTSILRYSQGWMAPKEHISFFHLSLILAFRTHRFPWRLSDRKYLLTRKRWIRAALVLACIYAFTFIASGVTTILTPLPINLRVISSRDRARLLAKPKRYHLPRMAQYSGDVDDEYLPMEGERMCPKYLPH